MKKILAVGIIAATFATFAGVPVKWTVETSRADTQEIDIYHGETLDIEVQFKSYGQILEIDTNLTAMTYWQTNGMGTAYWRTNNVTIATNGIMRASFVAEMDVGAKTMRGFIGIAGDIYRASFVLHFKDAPGYTPTFVEWPFRELDFAIVEVKNAPYYTKTESDARYTIEGDLMEKITKTAIKSYSDKWETSDTRITNLSAEWVLSGWYFSYNYNGTFNSDIYLVAENATNATLETISEPIISFDVLRKPSSVTNTLGFALLSNLEDLTPGSSIDTNAVLYLIGPATNAVMEKITETVVVKFSDWKCTEPERINDWNIYWSGGEGYNEWDFNGTVDGESWLIVPNYDYGYESTYVDFSYGGKTIKFNRTKVATNVLGFVSYSELAAATNVIGDLPTTVAQWETYWRGDRVRLSVTNYYGNTTGEPPRLRIEESQTNTLGVVTNWVQVWDEVTRQTNYYEKANERIDGISNAVMLAAWKQTNTQLANKAPRAWGTVTSTGSAAPSGKVWITEPNTVFAGGTEYAHVAVGDGVICVLVDSGAPVYTEGATGQFRFKDDSGENYFGFDVRENYTLGCRTDGISVQGTVVSLTYDLTTDTVPEILVCTNLLTGTWATASVTWEESPPEGTQICYINTNTNRMSFYKAQINYAGGAKFLTNMAADLQGGIMATNASGRTTATELPVYPVITTTGVVWQVKWN